MVPAPLWPCPRKGKPVPTADRRQRWRARPAAQPGQPRTEQRKRNPRRIRQPAYSGLLQLGASHCRGAVVLSASQLRRIRIPIPIPIPWVPGRALARQVMGAEPCCFISPALLRVPCHNDACYTVCCHAHTAFVSVKWCRSISYCVLLVFVLRLEVTRSHTARRGAARGCHARQGRRCMSN